MDRYSVTTTIVVLATALLIGTFLLVGKDISSLQTNSSVGRDYSAELVFLKKSEIWKSDLGKEDKPLQLTSDSSEKSLLHVNQAESHLSYVSENVGEDPVLKVLDLISLEVSEFHGPSRYTGIIGHIGNQVSFTSYCGTSCQTLNIVNISSSEILAKTSVGVGYSISPDGENYAMIVIEDGNYQVQVVDLTSDIDIANVIFSKSVSAYERRSFPLTRWMDSNTLFLAGEEEESHRNLLWEVKIENPDDKNLIVVIDGSVTALGFSNDGKHLAYSFRSEDSRSGHVRVVDITTGEILPYGFSPESDIREIYWSPDDKYIAFEMVVEGVSLLNVVQLATVDQTYSKTIGSTSFSGRGVLVNDFNLGVDNVPTDVFFGGWASDNRLIFTKERGGTFDVWQVNQDGTNASILIEDVDNSDSVIVF